MFDCYYKKETIQIIFCFYKSKKRIVFESPVFSKMLNKYYFKVLKVFAHTSKIDSVLYLHIFTLAALNLDRDMIDIKTFETLSIKNDLLQSFTKSQLSKELEERKDH